MKKSENSIDRVIKEIKEIQKLKKWKKVRKKSKKFEKVRKKSQKLALFMNYCFNNDLVQKWIDTSKYGSQTTNFGVF